MSKVEDIVKEAIDNVRADRTVTNELLTTREAGPDSCQIC